MSNFIVKHFRGIRLMLAGILLIFASIVLKEVLEEPKSPVDPSPEQSCLAQVYCKELSGAAGRHILVIKRDDDVITIEVSKDTCDEINRPKAEES